MCQRKITETSVFLRERFQHNACMSEKPGANSVNIDLTDRAKRELDRFVENSGMTRKSVMSRLAEWFVQLDRDQRVLIMGHLSDEAALVVALDVLRRGHDEATERAVRDAAKEIRKRRAARPAEPGLAKLGSSS